MGFVAIDGLTEEQLYRTVTGYLGPEKGVYVNGELLGFGISPWFWRNIFRIRMMLPLETPGKYITPEVVRRIQQDQIKKFIRRYQEIRADALTGLQKIKGNGVKHSPELLESEGRLTMASPFQ